MAGHHRAGAVADQVEVLPAPLPLLRDRDPAPEAVLGRERLTFAGRDHEVVEPAGRRPHVVGPALDVR